MKQFLALTALLFTFTACEIAVEDLLPPANIDEVRTYFNGNNAFVYTVDAQFTTGAAAIVSLDEPFTVLKTGIGEGSWFSTDVLFQSDSRYVYIIDRTNGNITVVDPLDEGKELTQISVGPASNPKAVVRINDKLYISRNDEESVLILDADTFQEAGTVDISKFSDADNLPDMGYAVTAEGKIWLLLERLDRTNAWTPSTWPTDKAYMVSIDPATDAIEAEIPLLGKNPYQILKIDPLTGNLYFISSVGTGAGIEMINPKTGTSAGWLVEPSVFPTGSAPDSGISFAVATTTTVFVVVPEGFQGWTAYDWDETVLFAIDRNTGEKSEVLRSSAGYKGLACLELSPGNPRNADKQLLITCAGPGPRVTKPGLRIFDPVTLKELTSAPLNTGLPPFGVTFFARPETEVVSVPATAATLP